MRTGFLACLGGCLLALSVGAAPLRAQDPGLVPQPSIESSPRMGELLTEAVLAYEREDFERARVLFEEVHALAPTARTWRSLALIALRQERFADAVTLFEASLASDVKPLSTEHRMDATQLLAIARARVESQPSPSASLPAEQANEEHVEVPRDPSLSPQPSAPEAQPRKLERVGPQTPSTVRNDERRLRPRRLKRTAYVLGALSGAAFLTSGAAFLTGYLRLSRIAEHCEGQVDGRCFESEIAVRRRAARLDLLGNLALGGVVTGSALGGASLTTMALYLNVRSPPTGGRSAVLVLRAVF